MEERLSALIRSKVWLETLIQLAEPSPGVAVTIEVSGDQPPALNPSSCGNVRFPGAFVSLRGVRCLRIVPLADPLQGCSALMGERPTAYTLRKVTAGEFD